jgi:hypothetical protein
MSILGSALEITLFLPFVTRFLRNSLKVGSCTVPDTSLQDMACLDEDDCFLTVIQSLPSATSPLSSPAALNRWLATLLTM